MTNESIESYYRHQIEEAKAQIRAMSDSALLGSDSEALVDYYTRLIELPIIEKDEDRDITFDQLKPTLIKPDGFPVAVGRRLNLRIEYPIKGYEKVGEVLSRNSNPSRLSGNFRDYSDISINVDLEINPEGDQSERIRRSIERLEEEIGWKNSNVNAGNASISGQLRTFIEKRKRGITVDHEFVDRLIEKVSIPLVRKGSAAHVPINLKVKKKLEPIFPVPKKPKEPHLEIHQVEAVLELIINQGKAFETTPKVYSKFGEEELRDVILGMLNAIFEGGATGETFVKTGKTDIHLALDEGGILSAECKIWDGAQLYHETIDQLLGYLTWRQNYGIIITFSKRKGFTKVIDKAKESTLKHETIKTQDITEIDVSQYVTVHSLPEDSSKTVVIHHVLFTLYVK